MTFTPVVTFEGRGGDRNHALRDRNGQATVDDARGRLSNWIEPTLGPLAIRKVTRDDLEELVDLLDGAVRGGGQQGRFGGWSLAVRGIV